MLKKHFWVNRMVNGRLCLLLYAINVYKCAIVHTQPEKKLVCRVLKITHPCLGHVWANINGQARNLRIWGITGDLQIEVAWNFPVAGHDVCVALRHLAGIMPEVQVNVLKVALAQPNHNVWVECWIKSTCSNVLTIIQNQNLQGAR